MRCRRSPRSSQGLAGVPGDEDDNAAKRLELGGVRRKGMLGSCYWQGEEKGKILRVGFDWDYDCIIRIDLG